jgi:tetratricopeptide (TPR) repeat protein
MKETPQIVAFYSFKGGVGRSMAVLNLSYALAAKGRHVLVLDMDLEAPGLSGFLHREKEIAGFARLDILDLVNWAHSVQVPLDPLSFHPLTDYVVPIAGEDLDRIPLIFSEPGRLDIILADEERNYYDRLSALAMRDYDQEALVRTGSVLRAWLKSLRFPIEVPDYYGPEFERSASYDYVFVDSRTGITEIGGLCVGPLSDQLVVLTALNDQNVVGTRKFLIEVGIFEEQAGPAPGSKPCLIVPSLVPAGEIEKRHERLKQIEQDLGQAVFKLSYHPQLALKEAIFTRDHREEYLAREYEELTQQIMRMAGDWFDEDLLTVLFKNPRSATEFREAIRQLLRGIWRPGSAPFLAHLLSTTNVADLSDEADYVLWDRVCQVLSSGGSSFGLAVVNTWANLLSEWAPKSKDPELAALRLEAAMIRYEEIIQSEEALPEQKANARYNRGLRYGQSGETAKAIADYDAVIQMADATAEQKARALVDRGVIYYQRGELENAIADFTSAIEMPGASSDQKAKAHLSRGLTYGQRIEPENAIAEYTAAIQMLDASTAETASRVIFYRAVYGQPGKPGILIPSYVPVIQMPVNASRQIGQKALALLGRGVAYGQRGEAEKAIADYAAVIEMPDAPAEQAASALFSRGSTYVLLGEAAKAINDYSAVIELPEAPAAQKVSARLGRGLMYSQLSELEKAIEDYAAVIQLPAAPADQKALARLSRGLVYSQLSELEKAIEDYAALIQLPNAPADQKTFALFFRGLAHAQRDERDKAFLDFAAVIEMPDAPVNQRAIALFMRGRTYREMGERDKAIADFTAVIEMHELPDEQKAQAFYARGEAHSKHDEHKKGIADYTAVIRMNNAPTSQKAMALCSRGWSYYLAGRHNEAIEDGRQAIALNPGLWTAHANLAIALLVLGNTSDALEAYDAALRLADAKLPLDEMEKDIRTAVQTYGQLIGADEVLARVAARRQFLSQ